MLLLEDFVRCATHQTNLCVPCKSAYSFPIQYRTTHKKHLLPLRMQAQFLNSPFLIASQEYCTYFLFPPFLVSSAVISLLLTAVIAFFFSILWSLPVCVTPVPWYQLYRYVCAVRTERRPFLVPTSNPISCFLSPGARY